LPEFAPTFFMKALQNPRRDSLEIFSRSLNCIGWPKFCHVIKKAPDYLMPHWDTQPAGVGRFLPDKEAGQIIFSGCQFHELFSA